MTESSTVRSTRRGSTRPGEHEAGGHQAGEHEEKEHGAPDRDEIDPIGQLAAAAGYDDPERWWEDVVEARAESREPKGAVFAAIGEAMAELRAGRSGSVARAAP